MSSAPSWQDLLMARLVAIGILLSKVIGLVREKALAHFFGVAPHLDVFRSAMRAPNLLQNLLGEQTLSAAFIPIYSRLLAEDRKEDAGRFAGAVLGLLLVITSTLVLVGMALAPWIVAVLAPGFLEDAAAIEAGTESVDRYRLTVQAVRIVFPMTGLLVLSAWALGILNSHRRFLLPYISPVLWNLAILTGLGSMAAGLWLTPDAATDAQLDRWLFGAVWGALAGGLLQFLVQLPLVLRLTSGLRLSLSTRVVGVRAARKMFGPALAGRGIVQIGMYIDQALASLIQAGAIGALGFAAVLINLPLSAFGMSVAAAELPELSSIDFVRHRQAVADRIRRGLAQAGFLVVPSAIGFIGLGYLVVGLLYRGGSFGAVDNVLVWAILAAYAIGLPASTSSRLLQNAFFATGDTRTPAYVAGLRLTASVIIALLTMFRFDLLTVSELANGWLATGGEADRTLGAVGLGLAASVGAWLELVALVSLLRRKLPELRLPFRYLAVRAATAVVLLAPAAGIWWLVADAGFGVRIQALSVLPSFAAMYLFIAYWLRLPELGMWLGRLQR